MLHSISKNRIPNPDDIIYSQEPRWHNTQEPQQPQVLQEEDSWEFAANKTIEKGSTQVEIDMESDNGSLVSDSVIDSESDTTNNSDSDSASISTRTPHLQTGTTAPQTASAAASAANRMVTTLPVNTPTGQPQCKCSANTFLISVTSVVALGCLISGVVCTLGAMQMLPNNSGEPLHSYEIQTFKAMAGITFIAAPIFTGLVIKAIVDRLRTNS